MFIIGETPESKPVQGNAALHNLYLYLCTRFGLHKRGYRRCNRPCKQGNVTGCVRPCTASVEFTKQNRLNKLWLAMAHFHQSRYGQASREEWVVRLCPSLLHTRYCYLSIFTTLATAATVDRTNRLVQSKFVQRSPLLTTHTECNPTEVASMPVSGPSTRCMHKAYSWIQAHHQLSFTDCNYRDTQSPYRAPNHTVHQTIPRTKPYCAPNSCLPPQMSHPQSTYPSPNQIENNLRMT